MNKNAVLIGLLVVALVVCLLMWMRSRTDRAGPLEVEIGWVVPPVQGVT